MSTTTHPSTAPGQGPPRSRPVPIVIGVLLALIGVPLLLGGLGLGVALATQRDSDGYFNLPSERISTTTSAITSGVIELGEVGVNSSWWADHQLATVRLSAESNAGGAVFVGVGPTVDVERYLGATSYDELTDVRGDPFRYDLNRRGSEGTLTSSPADQTFWTAQASGAGDQRLTWDVKPGTYTLVVMNADATSGVDVDVVAGGKFDFLEPIAVGLGIGGLVLVALGGLLIAYGVHTPGPTGGLPTQRATEPAAALDAPRPSPVTVTGHQDARLSRGLWLVKWLLALPHWIVLAFLWPVYVVLTVVAFFAILITGRYPRPLFDLNVGILRWSWRVQFYATSAIGTDRYPPFTLGHADYPADLDVAYPEKLSRGLVLVKSWLLAIPQLIVLAVLAAGWRLGGENDSVVVTGLIAALTLAAGLLLLFTGRYPKSLFDLLVGLNRWVFRVIAYVSLMTDDYPPFRLDQGPEEPPSPAEPPTPVAPVADAQAAPADRVR